MYKTKNFLAYWDYDRSYNRNLITVLAIWQSGWLMSNFGPALLKLKS